MSKINKRLKLILLVVAAFIAGVLSTFLTQRLNNQEDYTLLAKRVQIDNTNDQIVNFTSLRNELESYVTELEMDAEIDSATVYFEYLPTGVSVNVNEQKESIGASLMKVPFVMTLYKVAQEGKIDLDKSVPLKKEWLNDEYGTLYQKGVGYEITLREAAEITLKNSDNTALLLIDAQLQGIITEQDATQYLDMEFELNSDERVLIGARSYSSVLKCLYVACYNSKEHSQEILSYLTQSSFNNRLTTFIPEDIKVAHKIGTFSNKVQSDCGIFYVPERNYILCVMVEGNDPIASRTIAVISDKVYSYIKDISFEE